MNSDTLLDLVAEKTKTRSLYQNSQYICALLGTAAREDYLTIYDGLTSGEIPKRMRKPIARAMGIEMARFDAARRFTLASQPKSGLVFPCIEIIRLAGRGARSLNDAYARNKIYTTKVVMPKGLTSETSRVQIIEQAKEAIALYLTENPLLIDTPFGDIHAFQLRITEQEYLMFDKQGQLTTLEPQRGGKR